MKIRVKVIPKSSENKIEYDKLQDLYKVKVMVAPENGKANIVVTELLADYFELSTKNVHLASGMTSKIKIFEINND